MPDIYLVEFKGNRREFFYNTYHHSLKPNDYVIVQAERGEDAGILKSKLENESDYGDNEKPRSILRPASEDDRRQIDSNHTEEEAAWPKAESLIKKHKLEMKLVDIEYQYDRNKLTFFFTADHRVDFRALVRDLASIYKTRIELRQIGVRDEAKRLDGLGVCGLRLCCSTYLRKFEPISTQDARMQNLSLNPSKISGNCGRLLCCLKYEVDLYSEVKKIFPDVGDKVRIPEGEGYVDRVSYFDNCFVVRVNGEEYKIYADDVTQAERKNNSRFAKFLDDPKPAFTIIESHRVPMEEPVTAEDEEELKRLEDNDSDYGG